MRNITLLIILLTVTFSNVYSQSPERCAFERLLEEHLIRFPELENHLEDINRSYHNNNPSNAIHRNGIITIPVVVHVLFNTEEENISDLQIHSQIEVLNEDFRLLNENVEHIPIEFRSIAADTEIEFCLASVDPQGRPSTGINRVETTATCIGDIFTVKQNNKARLFYSNLEGADAWDTEHYLNIWVANTCEQFIGLSTNIALSALVPEEDGVVIDFNYFGNNCNSAKASPYHLGRTATHEIGHFFDLRHPWGSCDGPDADFVEDTPRQENPYYGCPVYPQSSCGTSDMFMNFMNYSDDACMALFTIGQKERMMASLAGPRNGLTSSVGCALLQPLVPFDADAILLYPNPASNCIHIDFNADVPGDVDVEMVNAMGQVLYHNVENSRNFRSIDAFNLPNGIYYISFRAAAQTFTKKVMINK